MLFSIVGLLTATSLLVASTISEPAVDIQYTPPPPPYVGEPSGRGRGGGTRGPECDRYAGVTPLVPLVQVGDRSIHWGLTTETHPTIWLAIPNGLVEGTPIELAIYDSQDQIIYRSMQQAKTTSAGSVSIIPTATAPPLSTDQVYRWTVSIFCDVELPDVPLQVAGYVQRVVPPMALADSLRDVDPLQRAALYAEAGIWYDALATLGHHYQQNPNPAIATAWTTLLQQANLDQVPNTPFGSCCSLAPLGR